jgi:hypothetical protein
VACVRSQKKCQKFCAQGTANGNNAVPGSGKEGNKPDNGINRQIPDLALQDKLDWFQMASTKKKTHRRGLEKAFREVGKKRDRNKDYRRNHTSHEKNSL